MDIKMTGLLVYKCLHLAASVFVGIGLSGMLID